MTTRMWRTLSLFVILFAALALRAQQPKRSGPSVDLKAARPVTTRYVGGNAGSQALARGSADPLSLATADFDEDGLPDLASGYGVGGAGAVSIHRGNVDALWPYGAALRNGTPPAFLGRSGRPV